MSALTHYLLTFPHSDAPDTRIRRVRAVAALSAQHKAFTLVLRSTGATSYWQGLRIDGQDRDALTIETLTPYMPATSRTQPETCADLGEQIRVILSAIDTEPALAGAVAYYGPADHDAAELTIFGAQRCEHAPLTEHRLRYFEDHALTAHRH